MKGEVVQHPSTPEEYTVDLTTINDPELYINETLEMALPYVIQMFIDRGFDCLDEAFQADFTTIVDVFRAVLFRDFNLYHPLQQGLSKKIDK